jgi:hypothetical protein
MERIIPFQSDKFFQEEEGGVSADGSFGEDF